MLDLVKDVCLLEQVFPFFFSAQELSKDNSVTSAIHSVLHLDIRPKTNFIIQPDNSRRRKGDP